jgi:hypothetical protein
MQNTVEISKKSSPVLVLLLTLSLSTVESLCAQKSGWSIKMYGLAQWAPNKSNWYTIGEGYSGESAANGVEKGASFGLECGLEYRVVERLGIEASIGYIPTNIHGGTHQTWRGIFSEPTGRISFIPLHLAVNLYLLQDEKWKIALGPLAGVGIIGELDLRPSVGRARHFNGRKDLLFGGQFVVSRAVTSGGWSVLASLKYMSTSYEVSEIGTGALKQELPMRPLSLRLGVAYSL